VFPSQVLVVGDVFAEKPFQMAFIEGNDVFEQLPPATAHPTFGDAILPGTQKTLSNTVSLGLGCLRPNATSC